MLTIHSNSSKVYLDSKQKTLGNVKDNLLPGVAYYPDKVLKLKADKKTLDSNAAEGKKGDTEKFKNDFFDYEADRVSDVKNMFLYHIHNEMQYHSSSLQILSKLYTEINKLEPKGDLATFNDIYKLEKNVDELQTKYNFVKGQTIKEDKDKDKDKPKQNNIGSQPTTNTEVKSGIQGGGNVGVLSSNVGLTDRNQANNTNSISINTNNLNQVQVPKPVEKNQQASTNVNQVSVKEGSGQSQSQPAQGTGQNQSGQNANSNVVNSSQVVNQSDSKNNQPIK